MLNILFYVFLLSVHGNLMRKYQYDHQKVYVLGSMATFRAKIKNAGRSQRDIIEPNYSKGENQFLRGMKNTVLPKLRIRGHCIFEDSFCNDQHVYSLDAQDKHEPLLLMFSTLLDE